MSKCITTAATLLFLLLLPQALTAGCLLVNPSFEFEGSGGPVFAGWNQFGIFGMSTNGVHGDRAARVTAPNWGGWDVSGYWQALDTSPGERWEASVCAWHTGTNPLQANSKAILNIEWRDSGDNLISYESHDVLTPGTPLDEVQLFTVTSGPAPSGAVTVRLLLGVIKAPTDPQPDVYYDVATFYPAGPPTHEDIQWNDFNGGRTISFAGRTWRVKGPGYYGPGPNNFCDSSSCVWVDGSGHLHLTNKVSGNTRYSTEVVLEEALGYGDYIFTTRGPLDALDPDIVLGLFLWEYYCWDPSNAWWGPYNEVDIEYSRWGNPGQDMGQFVAQPYDWPGNLVRYPITLGPTEVSSHAIRWLPDRVEFRAWRGGPDDESPGTLIHSWTYTGPHIPRPEQPRVHLNLWYINSPSANEEVIFEDFTFVQDCIPPHCDPVIGVPEDEIIPRLLRPAAPNPFSSQTTLAYQLETDDEVELSILDVTGRLIRTLEHGYQSAGEHTVTWNGRNDQGQRVAAGVYLYQLKTTRAVEARRVTLLK